MMRVGVIGYGYWGPNLVRNFAERPDAQVVVVADRRPERLAQVQRRYPTIRVTTDPADLIADSSVDAVVIATPVALHFDLAMAVTTASVTYSGHLCGYDIRADLGITTGN